MTGTSGTGGKGRVWVYVSKDATQADGAAATVGRAAQRIVRAPSASVVAATLLLVVVIGVLRPTYLQTNQIFDVLQASVYVGLLAGGMSYLISMREIDLSVGSPRPAA